MTLSAVSSRLSGLPAIFQSFGSFSVTSFGGSSLCRGFRDLAVGRGAARRRVRDHAVRGGALGRRHLPFVGGRLDQHHARGRAALAHIFLRIADAAAAAGDEIAPDAVAREVLARRRKFGRDFGPVAFELFGDELGEAGQRALAHLGAGDADDDGVVGLDHDPGVDFRRAVRGASALSAAERKIEAEREPAADSGGADDEGAAIRCCGIGVHGALPHAFAAAWMAARTCWKVPQRQMLVIASSMSASVGFGLSLSSAATAMIMPLWQ